MNVHDIHSKVMELNLPSKGANSKRSKVEKLAYASYEAGMEEAKRDTKEKAQYNGWSNYETWLVSLWMDNEQGTQEYWQRNATQLWDDAKAGDAFPSQTKEQAFLSRLSEYLKSEHEENVPTSEAGVYTDLLNAALASVNWYEIAEHYLDAVKEATTNV